jgi:hypothetical protein
MPQHTDTDYRTVTPVGRPPSRYALALRAFDDLPRRVRAAIWALYVVVIVTCLAVIYASYKTVETLSNLIPQ